MTNLKSATDFYHELALSGSMAQDSWEIMAPGMKERHLYFGDRPLCTVLRPLFHSEESYRWLAERTALTLSVFKKATEAMLADACLRRMVGLSNYPQATTPTFLRRAWIASSHATARDVTR